MKGKEEFPVAFAVSTSVSSPWRHQLFSPYPNPRLNLIIGCRLSLSHVVLLPDGGGGRRNTGGCWNKSLSLVGGFCSEMRGLPFKHGNSLSSLLFPFIGDKWKAIYLPVGLKILIPDFHQMSVCCVSAVVRQHNWYFSIQSNMSVSAGRVCVVFPVHHSSGEKKNMQDFYLCSNAKAQHNS